jgi:Bacterial aa3 type cytochrome c oxidase subunit IV
MADNHHSDQPSGMDYSEHEKTYALFNALLKWGVIGCVVLLLWMLAFCTPA